MKGAGTAKPGNRTDAAKLERPGNRATAIEFGTGSRIETDMKQEKITFYPENDDPVEFYVLEQTRLAGVNYLLVTDTEDEEGEALILKDLSAPEETESVYAVVSDEKELAAVAGIFEDLLEDVTFISE